MLNMRQYCSLLVLRKTGTKIHTHRSPDFLSPIIYNVFSHGLPPVFQIRTDVLGIRSPYMDSHCRMMGNHQCRQTMCDRTRRTSYVDALAFSDRSGNRDQASVSSALVIALTRPNISSFTAPSGSSFSSRAIRMTRSGKSFSSIKMSPDPSSSKK